ncbi:E3 ubiquitin-protein ligase rnf14 [Nowakowskiella sp. JEL0407]|nr:E3 ubiquitin-protein ligase rnf14 [Nowakowskiella sp. JEL0407]
MVHTDKLTELYVNSKGEERTELERRYDLRKLEYLLKDYSNRQSSDWINTNTTRCPKCYAALEQADGCNRMRCVKYSAHFCYLCGATLSSFTPYKHFGVKDTPCYGRTFGKLDAPAMFL